MRYILRLMTNTNNEEWVASLFKQMMLELVNKNSFSRAPEGYISDFNSNYVCSEKPEAEDLDKIDIDVVLSLLKPTLQDILNKIKKDFNK